MNKKNNISSWILVSLSLIIISVILWNTFLFFQKFKTEERSKMQIWSLAQAELTKSLDDDNISNLTLEVLKNNSTTPMIKVNKNGEIEFNNIANLKIDDSTKINKLIKKYSRPEEVINLYSDEYIVNILNILITPASYWHNHDKDIIWFDINKLDLLEKWVSEKIEKEFILRQVNSSQHINCSLELDQHFKDKYDSVYNFYDIPKAIKTLI